MSQVQRLVPKQARSRELVDRILTAAGELFAGRGFPDTTTNLIAERAGVSIGSLYQFFADKEEILAALQDKWTARLGAELDERLQVDAVVDFAATVDHVLDVHDTLNRQPPGLLGFLLISTVDNGRSDGVSEAIRRRLVDMLAFGAPTLSPQRRKVVAGMLVHISNGLYTVGRTAGATDPAVRAEVREALLSYLTPILRDPSADIGRP
ncbi:MAG TPA: TetR/AcrR family transcriptional regulator [Pseudonocardiaceae bacterium]|nr:TetR/AcrR family transcriptional regulator [Pseudonocardiaceae bacterium]